MSDNERISMPDFESMYHRVTDELSKEKMTNELLRKELDCKEKLIELFRGIAKENCFGSIEKIVDYLIDNGVTVQEIKPGDKVWYVSNVVGEVCEATITRVEYNYFTEPQEWLEVSFVSSVFGKSSERNRVDLILNKRVFLTKEEAEAHLPQPPKGE